ncbi:MAG: UvrD-helicase domain-containing protein [Acidobacteriia bacterium]|nr:UvrD-helicase domain-containing protein [Terriglobia bacterium]
MSDPRTAASDVAADRKARLLAQTLFDRPLVLEAGAGTGKTATLVGRVLAWCLGPGWRRAADEVRGRQRQSGRREPESADRVAARVLDRVVAITFTEAAAAEMANRVAQALAEVQQGRLPKGTVLEALTGAEGEEQERAAALLVALDHLQVATIHAFCRRLLAAVPLEAGLHPSFTVDPESFVLAEVVQEVVEVGFRQAVSAPQSALFGLAARGIDPAKVVEALVTLTSRGVPPNALDRDPLAADAVEALTAEVRAVAVAVRDAAQARLAGAAKAKKGSEAAAGAGVLADTLSRGRSPASVAELCGRVADALPDGVVGRLKDWAKGTYTATERDLLGEAAAELIGPAGRLAAVAKHLAALDPELLDVARRALAPLLAEVHRAMRARGAQTFAALLRDAHDLLVRNPGLRTRLRSEISQLMVDEFQDTDRRQCEILRLLALDGPPQERPGLFLIGDPKQSIYGWRDADLVAYDGFLSLVRAAGGEVISLCVNFRSRPEILAEVERVVHPVMRHESGMQPSFQPLYPCEERSVEAGPPATGRAPVEYWVSWTAAEGATGALAVPSAQEAADLEAAALAADIRQLGESGVPWGAFGVLLRSTSSIDTYLHAFRDAGVPYAVERDRSYYRRREIIDAAALVRTVLDPGDHLALVATLRSSAVGVPDAALIPLWTRSFPDRVSALAAPDKTELEALQRLVREAAAALPEDVPGIERVRGWEQSLVDFLVHLARLRASFETDPAAVFVERLRTLTQFEACEAARSLGRYRVANLERFFRTLVDAMEADADPHAVLRTLRTAVAGAREAEEGRPLSATDDAVRVTTIHKAKGLDFGHVYLVQAHKTSRGDARQVVDVEEFGGGLEYALFGAKTPGWHAVETRRRRVGQAEMVRTLYVAMTRARERLVIAGVWPDAGGAPAGGDARSHMDLLSHRTTPEGGLAAAAARANAAGGSFEDADSARWEFPALRPVAALPEAESAREAVPTAREIARQAARLDALRRDAESRQARPFSSPASAEAHRRLLEELAEERLPGRAARPERSAATAAGSAVHRVLERLDLEGDLAEEFARGAERLPRDLEGLVDPEGAPAALARARDLLERLRNGPLMERLRAIARDVIARELPVLLPPGEEQGAPVGFISGVIDLVYRDPDTGELVIADYKTDEVATKSELEERGLAYAAQGAVYRRALEDALGLTVHPRFELWFVFPGEIVSVRPGASGPGP